MSWNWRVVAVVAVVLASAGVTAVGCGGEENCHEGHCHEGEGLGGHGGHHSGEGGGGAGGGGGSGGSGGSA